MQTANADYKERHPASQNSPNAKMLVSLLRLNSTREEHRDSVNLEMFIQQTERFMIWYGIRICRAEDYWLCANGLDEISKLD